jgi:hypothetical protein
MRALFPDPAKGKEWQRIDSFSAVEEDPALKLVFNTAIDNGCDTIGAKANEK